MFAQNQDLKKHERTHTGEKNLCLLILWQEIWRKSEYKDAWKNSHKQKPFECLYCDKTFAREDIMKKHERTQEKNLNNIHFVTKKNKGDFTVITTNVDNLHERVGSSKVLHIHGDITKRRYIDENRSFPDCVLFAEQK